MNIAIAKPRLSIALMALAAVLVGSLWTSTARSEAARVACPGTFSVLHNDMIGKLSLPKGQYTITVFNDQKVNCQRASKRFAEFLQDYDGRLPSPWVYRAVAVGDGKFFHKTNRKIGFRVQKSSPTPGPGPAPGKFQRCPGTFRVLNNDRIGNLFLPKGPYYISVSSSGAPTCASAESRFKRFLRLGQPRAPWIVKPASATFKNPRTGAAFRVKQAF